MGARDSIFLLDPLETQRTRYAYNVTGYAQASTATSCEMQY